jgi:hypothetical protein
MRLVGCEPKCFNAIFVRDGLGEDIFPAISPAECFEHSMAKYNIGRVFDIVDLDDPFWEQV